MPEVSTPSVSQTEIEAGPNYFAFHIHEIEELFAQKEDLITSVSSKDPMLSAGTCATVKDGIDDNHCKTKEGATPSLSTALFYNGVGDKLSVLKKERLESSLKESVNVFNQEVDETLHSVLGMYKVKKSLRAREDIANNSISAADVYKRQSFVKKRKLSHSPSSTGVAKYDEEASISEGRGIKDSDVVSSEESLSKDLERICLECKTTSTPQWREGPAGILCNACGIRNKKKGMSPQGLKEVEKTTKPELDDDLKFLLDVEGPHAQEIVKEVLKKYSDELDGKLGHMEQQLEKYLDVVVSKSRKMSVEEKLELKKLIHNLPQKNLDRVVEIIVHHRKLPEELPCNEIRVDLENEDDVTLWRLYYYTKAAEKAKRFQDKKN